jgi:hypothetical protein
MVEERGTFDLADARVQVLRNNFENTNPRKMELILPKASAVCTEKLQMAGRVLRRQCFKASPGNQSLT